MLEKSVNFLMENAGTVIKYRLHKELLKDISEANEKRLLEEIYRTSRFQLLKLMLKPMVILV